jgi:hypothetical protein
MKKTITTTVCFKAEHQYLIDWIEGQADKKYLKLGSFSAVVRRCIEIVRERNLLSIKK